VAELLVYGDLSTGAANDLVGNTELARKMVREWGMSEEIGPMAWGSQGQVFLGEDLMHTRDYSEDTSRVIDDEVERILRAQEERALEVLSRHRGGLDAVAHALLTHESIDGAEVGRLVDEAYGRPVHESGAKVVPHFNGNGNTSSSGANGHGADPAVRPEGGVTPSAAETGSHPAASQTGPEGRTWAPPAWPGQPNQAAPGGYWPPPQWPAQPGQGHWPPPQWPAQPAPEQPPAGSVPPGGPEHNPDS